MSMSTASPVRRLLGEPERTTIGASRAALLLLAVGFGALSAAGTDVSLRTQMIAYLVGMVALNLPHGGYEHFSNLRRRGLPFGARYVDLYVGFVRRSWRFLSSRRCWRSRSRSGPRSRRGDTGTSA